jgi:uncharacterized cofD-like protein
MRPPKIVVIGGGTGLSVLLRGLKRKPFHITAVVTVGDDGGSSGRLRNDLKIPPPGDIRNVILALSDTEPMMEKVFQHRFKQGNELEGHNVGNLILAALTEITGDFNTAIRETKRVLAVRGNVLPVSNDIISLQAEMEDGEVIKGESKIPQSGKKIKKVSLFPEEVKPSHEAIRAIEKADMVVLGPGSLYTSLIPNLLFPEVVHAIKQSQAKKIYICNVMTQHGETDNFSAFDHLRVIYDHIGVDLFDKVLVNTTPIPATVLESYKEKDSFPVRYDKEKLSKYGFTIIDGSYVVIDGMVRHNASEIANHLEKIVMEEIKNRNDVTQ